MDKTEVQNVVMMTINELRKQGMLKDLYSVVLRDIEPVIKEYFRKKDNKILSEFFRLYSDDQYIDIIYLHYRDNITMESIANILDKDISTIKRNKKRLIIKMYELLEI